MCDCSVGDVHPCESAPSIFSVATLRYLTLLTLQEKNIGWESGRQKRASHPIPELKESLQLKWHNMEGKWPSNELVPGFEDFSKV